MPTVNISALAHTWADQLAPNTNYGFQNYTTVGSPDVSVLGRTWIKFSLVGIPTNATIVSVTLYMQHFFVYGGYGDVSFTVKKLNSGTWAENTLTWNNAPDATVNATGSTFTILASDPYVDYMSCALPTSEVQTALAAGNVSWRLEADNTTFGFYMGSKNFTAPPSLIVSYTVNDSNAALFLGSD